MKLLIENFKKFLNERSTDEYYRRYTDFYGNLFKSGEWARYYHVWEYTPTKTSREACPGDSNLPLTQQSTQQTFPGSHIPSDQPEHASNWFYVVPKRKPIENIYNKYKEETEDNGELITDITMFALAHLRFRILIAHPSVRCGAGGDMSPKGVMRLFQGPAGYFLQKPDLNQLMEWISTSDAFVHEFAHWVNAFRSGYEETRSKGGSAQYQIGTKEYAASTEELQARVITFSKKFIDYFLKKPPATEEEQRVAPDWSQAQLSVIKAIQDGNIKKLVNFVLDKDNTFGRHFGSGGQGLEWDPDGRPGIKDDPKAAKRLLGRLYQVFEYFVNNKDKFPATKGEQS